MPDRAYKSHMSVCIKPGGRTGKHSLLAARLAGFRKAGKFKKRGKR